MLVFIEDKQKQKQAEFPKSFKHRPILTSRKIIKLKKIKKTKKIHKKNLKTNKKIKIHIEKYEENDANKGGLMFNESYPKFLSEKENLTDNNLKFNPILQSSKLINQSEPGNTGSVINDKNASIKKIEDSNLFGNIINNKDINKQNNASQQNLSNNKFNFIRSKFTLRDITIMPFETRSLDEEMNSNFSSFIPIRECCNYCNSDIEHQSLFTECNIDTIDNDFSLSNHNIHNNDNLIINGSNNNRNNNVFINYIRINDNFHNHYIESIIEKLSITKIKVTNLEDNNKRCIICLEDFRNNENVYKLPCKHIFHIHCLNEEIKSRQKCPICRKELKY